MTGVIFTLETKPLVEVTNRAFEVLIRELGPSDAIRFMNQFEVGFGVYTAERDALFGDLTPGPNPVPCRTASRSKQVTFDAEWRMA